MDATTPPIVRFACFPRLSDIFFCNFADKSERIEKGMRVCDVAARQGWDCVLASQRDYGLLPAEYFAARRDDAGQLAGG